MNGMFAAAGTPSAVVNRVSQEVAQILCRPDTKERFMSIGVETVGSTPEEFDSVVKAEMARWGKLIKSVGIRAD